MEARGGFLNFALSQLSIFKRQERIEETNDTAINDADETSEASPSTVLPSIEQDDIMSCSDGSTIQNEEASEDESGDDFDDELEPDHEYESDSSYSDEDASKDDASMEYENETQDEDMTDVVDPTSSKRKQQHMSKSNTEFSSLISPQQTPGRPKPQKRPNWGSPISLSQEKKRREDNIASQTVGWLAENVSLYRALQVRGFTPLMPSSWMLDFPSLPLALFTSDEPKAVIKPLRMKENYATDFHGARVLRHLMSVGQQVRERICRPHRVPAELYIKKAIQIYTRWSLLDADIRGRRAYLPLIATATASKETDPMLLQQKLIRKMQRLKERWREALCASQNTILPPLYGVMVSHSVTAILAPTNSDDFGEENGRPDLKNSLRILSLLDWGEEGQDVWTAFAIALLVVHCRDILVELLEKRVLHGIKIAGPGEVDLDA